MDYMYHVKSFDLHVKWMGVYHVISEKWKITCRVEVNQTCK